MDTSLAFTIIGVALTIVGALFFLFPVAVNEKVMDPLSESAVRPAAALRSVLGGSAIWSGVMALLCRTFPPEQASQLLTAYGIGMSIILASIAGIKIRNFVDEIPYPPMVLFVVLIVVAFYAA
tara:strand:- start:193 stop:561 length:369 start_codon:yes stop_codon:yes gene_type:complete